MPKQFNKKDLRIDSSSRGNEKTLFMSQKRSGNTFYMNTIINGSDCDWFLTRAQAEELYRHLGGMLSKDE
jgi:hypothetical protein